MPWILTMVKNNLGGEQSEGERLYMANCATCHGIDRTGEQHLFPSSCIY